MRILVTGGAGFIGSHVVDEFLEAGHKVIVVDDLSTGRRANLNPEAKFYEVDIRSQALKAIFEREKPEVVDHHAAQVDVRRSMADPIFDAQVNILGSLNLLACAHTYGVRKIIYISSGGAIYGEPVALPCTEDHPIQPLCPYGASKYIMERYLYLYKQNYGLDYTVLRYGNVYGPRQDPSGEAGVVAIFTGQMLKGQSPMINGSGEQERDFVYVGDCAHANVLALDRGAGSAYNLGTGQGTSINKIFATLKCLTGYEREPVYGPAKAGETFRIYLDAERAHEELDWRPRVTLQEGLQRTVAYFRDE